MSRMVSLAILSLSALAAGCAGPVSLQTDVGHPANPGSAEGLVIRTVRLEPDEFDRAPGGIDVADPVLLGMELATLSAPTSRVVRACRMCSADSPRRQPGARKPFCMNCGRDLLKGNHAAPADRAC